MDYALLSQELIRALRGKRSQRQLSRRLGYRSNVLYRWESGRSTPDAAEFFRMAHLLRVPVASRLQQFYGDDRSSVPCRSLTTAEGTAEWVRQLVADTAVNELSRQMGCSRYRVSRWCSGKTTLDLRELLQLIEATTLRVLDFIAVFADPATLASSAAAWKARESSRRAAYDFPWSHAVLRVLELAEYQRLKQHRPGWIARYLGISRQLEDECVQVLTEAGQIRKVNGRLQVCQVQAVDTRQDPERSRSLRRFWLRVAADRLGQQDSSVYAYNLCSLSRSDLEALRALHRKFFQEMQAIVARSEPGEEVVLLSTQILPLLGAAGGGRLA